MTSKNAANPFTERQKLLLRVHFSLIDLIDEWSEKKEWAPNRACKQGQSNYDIAERLYRSQLLKKTPHGHYKTTDAVHNFIKYTIPQ